MEVHFTAELEKKLQDLAARTGRGTGELIQDAVAGYVDGLAGVGDRYDDLKSGRVKPMAAILRNRER